MERKSHLKMPMASKKLVGGWVDCLPRTRTQQDGDDPTS